jgi:hypothetical protein
MTKHFLLLAFSFFLTTSWAGDTLVAYGNYSFRIPNEFKKVGKQKCAAIQAKHPQWKGLVAYVEQGTQHPKSLVFSYDSLRQVTKRSFEERYRELSDALYVNGITHDTLHYDTNLGCIYGPFIENGDTSLYGFVFTEFGVIKLYLDHPAGYTLDDKEMLEGIMTSLEKDVSNSPIPKKDASEETSNDRHTWHKVTAALLILFFGWIIRKFARNEKLFRLGRRK